VRESGFVASQPRVFESNTVFDTPELSLRTSSRLLRIREAGGVATLTFKGEPVAGKHKSREELEVKIDHAAAMTRIVERLGYRPVFRYEKYRTEFHQPRRAGVAMLDETPVGVFLELEGTPHWIDLTARCLGFQESDYITASYARIYVDWCAAHRRTPGDMTFE
jgi:adenylate cyclase class 2